MLEFRVLGPVRVIKGGEAAPVQGPAVIDVLALLLLSANQVVRTDELAETVWYGRPANNPRAAVHSVIARLRHMTDRSLIETHPGGYQITTDPEHFDLLRFERLLGEADQVSSPEQAEVALSQALSLWRGQPLGNVDSALMVNEAVPRLNERYLNACERWADLCLSTGRPELVIARLSSLAETHPFRENLAGQLMLALYRAGRQVDALATFDALQRRLGEEMGLEPGPALRSLQLRILRTDTSLLGAPADPADGQVRLVLRQDSSHRAPVVPRHLPPDLNDFCGRDAEVESLASLLNDDGAAPVVTVSGIGGVGKTALAIHLAHSVAGEFAGGQLFADLSGASASPVEPAEVLAAFLEALGVPQGAIPCEPDARGAMYRSLTAERRLVIVLDNVADEGQVRPLLPAGRRCAVIVTSRARLTGLPGSYPVNLRVLDTCHAATLLGRIIGQSRAAGQERDIEALAGMCGGLPLALRIAGARLSAKTHWPVAKLTGRLADTRRTLNELVHRDLDVRASFALSYWALDGDTRRMLRSLSELDAPDFPAWAGAAMLEISAPEAEDACERLLDAQLLDAVTRARTGEIRYRMHDLVRAYARELAVQSETLSARTAALARAFGSWLAHAERAHCEIYGANLTILHGAASRWVGSDAAARRAIQRDPLGWLNDERRALAAAIRQSSALGLDELCWDLAWTSVTLYEARGYLDDWSAAHRHALAATRASGNQRGLAAALALGSSLLATSGRFPGSLEQAHESLRLFADLSDIHGRGLARYRLIVGYSRAGQADKAIRLGEQALDDARAANDTQLEASLLRELASAHMKRGDHDHAAQHLTRSLGLQGKRGNHRGISMVLHMLGELQLRRGDYSSAERTLRDALVKVQRCNDMVGQAHVLVSLGDALDRLGHRQEAVRHLRNSLMLARQLRQRPLEARCRYLLTRTGQSQATSGAEGSRAALGGHDSD